MTNRRCSQVSAPSKAPVNKRPDPATRSSDRRISKEELRGAGIVSEQETIRELEAESRGVEEWLSAENGCRALEILTKFLCAG
jgi:hypothetical protein